MKFNDFLIHGNCNFLIYKSFDTIILNSLEIHGKNNFIEILKKFNSIYIGLKIILLNSNQNNYRKNNEQYCKKFRYFSKLSDCLTKLF